MNARSIALWMCFSLATTPVIGCLNEYRQNTAPTFFKEFPDVPIHRWGPKPSVDPHAKALLKIVEHPPTKNWNERAEKLRAAATKKGATYQTQSDYAVALLHIGKTKEAIAILEPLAQQRPDDYKVVANLGTAYELDGQNERALALIKKGVELNPQSHRGTEWLHVKILEAKIALAKDPKWLEKHTTLGYGFTPSRLPMLAPEIATNPAELKRVADATLYQLTERLPFVRPPDQIVADLLFQMGEIYARKGRIETALPIYRASLRFGDVRKETIQDRLRFSIVTDVATSGVTR